MKSFFYFIFLVGFGIGSICRSESTANVFTSYEKAKSQMPTDEHGKPATLNTMECAAKAETANTMCMESTSPKIGLAIATINTLMSGASSLGLAEACSKYRNAMDVASAALTAFSAQCSLFKYQCESACAADIKNIVVKINACGASAGTCTEPLLKEKTYATALLHECDSYKLQLASAGAGVVKLIQNAKKAKNCEEQTKADPAAVASTTIDCALKENYQNTKCICERTPRAPGCPGVLPGDGNQNYSASVVGTSPATKGLGDNAVGVLPPSESLLNSDLGKVSPSSGGGSVSGSASGGSLSGSGGGGAAGKAAQKANGADGGKGSGLNTNIISGDYGGGGGGGSRSGGSGGGYADSAYKAYMPGGSKDPARILAGSHSTTVLDVTGSGGEDNFKKVNARYKDNRPTLGE